jgi:predicted RNA-binding protein with EMAP domain
MNEIVKEIVLTRTVNQIIGEIKGKVRRGEDKKEIEEVIKTAKRAYNAVKNKTYINLKERELKEEVKEELIALGKLDREEIEEVEREEREIHKKMIELWEKVKEDGKMEVNEALSLLNENSREALKRTGLKMIIRGNEAGLEILTLIRQ